MNAVVFAYHNMGIAGLNALTRQGFNIQAIFSHKDNPDENCWFDSVAEWGHTHHIPVFCPPTVNTPEWVTKIRRMQPDVMFSFYYRTMLNKEIFSIPPGGAFNLHGSLLPAYRGKCPVNWVLVNGEHRTGVTLHYMVEKPDAGDIVGQKEVPIDFEDTAATVYNKLCTAATKLLEELLPLIQHGTTPRTPQDLRSGSYYGGRNPEDGKIDWRWPVMRIYNLIRAVTEPYPGAFTHLPDGQKALIWWGLPEETIPSKQEPGTVEPEDGHVFVRASDGRIRLVDMELPGLRLKDPGICEYFKTRKGIILQ
jgi:methionyl-tRNA formyltransferase